MGVGSGVIAESLGLELASKCGGWVWGDQSPQTPEYNPSLKLLVGDSSKQNNSYMLRGQYVESRNSLMVTCATLPGRVANGHIDRIVQQFTKMQTALNPESRLHDVSKVVNRKFIASSMTYLLTDIFIATPCWLAARPFGSASHPPPPHGLQPPRVQRAGHVDRLGPSLGVMA